MEKLDFIMNVLLMVELIVVSIYVARKLNKMRKLKDVISCEKNEIKAIADQVSKDLRGFETIRDAVMEENEQLFEATEAFGKKVENYLQQIREAVAMTQEIKKSDPEEKCVNYEADQETSKPICRLTSDNGNCPFPISWANGCKDCGRNSLENVEI